MEDFKIKNFCIIAHIDHGKSTLADRFLEITNTLQKREMKHGQMLDLMDLEQEKGITIKLQPVSVEYKGYKLNLIDTPGHVDFQYEVSRSLAAVEGAILVVDATQGIQAQTLSNLYMALEHDLDIIPVLNKIDLKISDVEKYENELSSLLGISKNEIIKISAKYGENIHLVLDFIIEKIKSPKKYDLNHFKALIFDSKYDNYKGVIAYVRVFSGSISTKEIANMFYSKEKFEVLEVGHFKPFYEPCDVLNAGEIGYIITGLKDIGNVRVGDTIHKKHDNIQPLGGYKIIKPSVYSSIFTIDGRDYQKLRDSLLKLQLNDSSLWFEPISSTALGNGFKCGFLGLLHMEIIGERLQREYDLNLIFTSANVEYEIVYKNGEIKNITSAFLLPDPSFYDEIREPFITMDIITPTDFIGNVLSLITEHRGVLENTQYINESRVVITAVIPLVEVIIEFYDKLKNYTSGYASFNYEFLEFRKSDLVRLDILIDGEKVEAFSQIIPKQNMFFIGRTLTKKLKEIIPKQQFKIAIQAAVGGKVVAREDISAYRKDVTAKLYGGDITRKNKLRDKQKKGKKKMKQIGKVSIPQNVFLDMMKK